MRIQTLAGREREPAGFFGAAAAFCDRTSARARVCEGRTFAAGFLVVALFLTAGLAAGLAAGCGVSAGRERGGTDRFGDPLGLQRLLLRTVSTRC